MDNEGRGRRLSQVIKELNALLRGWMQYFRLAEMKGIFDELDGWIRRKLRCLIWLRWKRPKTRIKDAGTSHMNEALGGQGPRGPLLPDCGAERPRFENVDVTN